MNFDNLVPDSVKNTLNDEQLAVLMANIKKSAEEAIRGTTADTHVFGASKYRVLTGQKGTTIAVTREPVRGKRVKGTYLTTMYRATQILELADANPDTPYFEWLKGYVEIEMAAERLELL